MADQDCMCLLDVTSSCVDIGLKNPESALDGAKRCISRNGAHNLIHLFKVEGENRILAVLKRGAEEVLSGLNHHCGKQVVVTATPLTSYEGFSRNVLKVDADLCVEAHDVGTDKHGVLFWEHMKIGFQGRSAPEMLSIWREEAETALSARKLGRKNDLYKVIAQREVHLFIRASPERLDGVSFALPLMSKMGDQVEITCKRIFLLNEQKETDNDK